MTGKLHFISAGAGSGKTFRLTEILHEQLSSGAVRPSGVIATTFTKKAAAELRERVRSHLLSTGSYALANAMGQARIGTVNSVCGGLLKRFAFEAGLATEQQVLEEGQASVLVKQAIDAVIDGPNVADLLEIVNRLGIEDWQKELNDLLDKARANDIAPALLPAFAAENAREFLQYWPKTTKQDLSKELLKVIASAVPTLTAATTSAKPVKKTIDYLTLVRHVERGVTAGNARWSEWVKLSKELPEKGLIPVAEPIRDLAARFSEHCVLQTDVAQYLERIFSLCAEAMKVYDLRKREMGVVDFVDQEHLLLKVLDEESVAATLKEELDLLLVDEFQDTSPIQLALFLKLANYAKAIYWVGDIKQAIYGFRGSDTELMEAILRALPGLGGTTEILGLSRRSREPLVQIVNEVFKSAFAGSLAPKEVELSAVRKEPLSDPAFANWILNGKNKGQEASALASGIRELVNSGYQIFDRDRNLVRPVTFGDIAILCKTNSGVNETAAGLHALDVPTATAQPGLLKTPEAVLALACLRRLNDPSDTIATAEILSLADCQEPESWVADRLRHLAANGSADHWLELGDSAHPLVARLARMRASLPLLAPREALQAVVIECQLPNLVLRWKQSPSVARIRLANLEEMLALAAKYEDACTSAQHAASVSGLILWLNDQADNLQDGLAEPGIDAVKVMTHHGSKGLEWPVVILMDLHASVQDRLWSITVSSRKAISVKNPLMDRFIRYWPWPFGLQKSVSLADTIANTALAQAFRKSATEEAKRLLYVSMTRARDLVVLARSERKQTGEWLNTLGADWLLPEGDQSSLTLPSGRVIEGLRSLLDPIEPDETPSVKAQKIYWFKEPDGRKMRLPLVFNPSSAISPACKVVERVTIGKRIGVARGTDMAALGTAIHACIAATFTDEGAPLSADEVSAILSGLGAGDSVTSKEVLAQIQSLQGWIAGKWGNPEAYAEIPVEAVLDTGQIINGRIDLLLKVASGWILLDHKANPQAADQWDRIAEEYAGQLTAYKGAVEQATGQPVLESWLFFPVSAGAIRIDSTGHGG